MKKFIAIVLMFAMCLSLFACKKDEEGPSEGLKKAQEFVRSSYIGDSATTSVDIKLMGVTRVDNVEYQIEWSANSDKITFTRGDDKFVTLHVPTDNLEDIAYVLTATISDGDNSLTVDFERKVPARAGIPATLADGTYVIVNGNLTFSSLDQSKNYGYVYPNEVTITDGVVSGHFKADVLTIKNVDGGFTIQDAYGRYVYMKGNYNSFNVDAAAPEEGHVWQLLAGKDGEQFIINKLNGKTLAYDTQHSSWGAYPELTETRLSKVTVIAATAPDVDPEKPDVPAVPVTGAVENPVAGTAYKLALVHGGKGNAILYFTGAEKPNCPWYMLSSAVETDAIDVFVEEVDGGLRLYFTIDGTKTYLDMHKDGTHYSLRLTTEPAAVYTWNTEHKTFVATVEDKECFIGTSDTYDTFSCNKMEYVASSYPAHLYLPGGAAPEVPDVPSEPSESVDVATGTYVIVHDNLTLSGLAEDKNHGYSPATQVTVADGVVTGYTDLDVLTITAVDGGFTIQDCFGRYMFLKGTYNSFNVSKDAPAEGHIWQLQKVDGKTVIVNKMNGKTLAYDTQFSSWGIYPEITETRLPEVSLIAVN